MKTIFFDIDFVPKDLEDLLLTYYRKGNPTTYYSNTEHEIQCTANRNRSFDDLLLLAKHYFPDTTIKDVVKVYYEFNKKNKEGYGFLVMYCPNIEKPVIAKGVHPKSYRSILNMFSNLNNGEVKGNSEYSKRDIMNIVEELKEEENGGEEVSESNSEIRREQTTPA